MPGITVTTLTDEQRSELLTDLTSHAAACGRLDCGHTAKSPYPSVRRACILYTAEGMGLTVDLDAVSPDVAAIVGVLRSAGHARPVYVRAGRSYAAHTPGLSAVMPDAEAIRITPERYEVFSLMLAGYSATQIGSTPDRPGITHRAVQTVKSHAGYLRREMNGHDATACLLALVLAGKLTDEALSVPSDDE